MVKTLILLPFALFLALPGWAAENSVIEKFITGFYIASRTIDVNEADIFLGNVYNDLITVPTVESPGYRSVSLFTEHFKTQPKIIYKISTLKKAPLAQQLWALKQVDRLLQTRPKISELMRIRLTKFEFNYAEFRTDLLKRLQTEGVPSALLALLHDNDKYVEDLHAFFGGKPTEADLYWADKVLRELSESSNPLEHLAGLENAERGKTLQFILKTGDWKVKSELAKVLFKDTKGVNKRITNLDASLSDPDFSKSILEKEFSADNLKALGASAQGKDLKLALAQYTAGMGLHTGCDLVLLQ